MNVKDNLIPSKEVNEYLIIVYKKYNNSSNPGFGEVRSVCPVRKANLCANWHGAGTLTVP